MLTTSICLLAFLALCHGASWTYQGDHGPSHWATVASSPDCDAQSQSPINIVTASTSFHTFPAFDVSSYATIGAVTAHTISNNGHTVQLTVTGNMTVRGGGLPTDYRVAQFHFHWGANDNQGSEHTFDNKMYPMEVHIVHYRANESSVAEAAPKPEGLAVLGFMFEVSSEVNTNPLLVSVINNLTQIRNKDDVLSVPPQPFRPMLPTNLDTFYRYSGSLTTPPCYQSVIWTVFANPIPISSQQLAEFRAELSGEEAPYDHIVDNYRPVQNLNGRTVYRSFSELPTTNPAGHANAVRASVLLSLLLAAVASLFSRAF